MFLGGFLSKNSERWNFSHVNLHVDVDSCGSKAQRPDDPGLWPCQHSTLIGYRLQPGRIVWGKIGSIWEMDGKGV